VSGPFFKKVLTRRGQFDGDYAIVSTGQGLESSIIIVHCLKELGVPHIIAIKSVSPHKNTINPSPDARIKGNDVLIVFGEVKDIETLDQTMNQS
jgi:Trk K+ transport system NAD-binding subunit